MTAEDELLAEVLERYGESPNQRLKEVMTAAIRHVHAFAREVKLTPQEFEEETVGWRRHDPPGPCPHGFHTLVGAGRFSLVDGKRMELSLPMAWFRIRRKLFG